MEEKKLKALDRLFYRLGFWRGLYRKGQDAPLTDATAWMDSQYWGPGLLQQRKPKTKAQAIEQFTSWVYICAKINSRAIASIPLELYVQSAGVGKSYQTIQSLPVNKSRLYELMDNKGLRPYLRKAANQVEEVTDHVFLDLMQNVNPFMNSSDLMELTSIFLDLTGESYWYILKDKLKTPFQLWPVPSQYITPIPGKKLDEFISGYLYKRGSIETIFSPDEIIRFSYPNPANQFKGMSCVIGITDAVYTNSQMYAYEENLFENKARTGGVLESATDVSQAEIERMRLDWKQRFGGTENAGSTPILPPGVKYIKDAMTNEELSFIEGRKITREEICIGLDVPTALFDPNSIRSNVEGAQYTHAKYGIQPRLRKIEEKINEQLLPMFDDSGKLFCAFDNPVPEDKAFLLEKRKADLQTGVSTINEERSIDGKEPVEGGDTPLVPFSVVTLDSVAAGGSGVVAALPKSLAEKVIAEIREILE